MLVGARKQRRERRVSGRPRSRRIRGPVHHLRHDLSHYESCATTTAKSRPSFRCLENFLQQRIGSFDTLTATTFSSDRPLERLAYEFLLGMSKTIDQVDPATATRLLDQALDLVAMAFLADRMRERSPDQSLAQIGAALIVSRTTS